MKHAAVKTSSVAKSTATRVVATLALATAATAIASPAMAHEGRGHDGHSADHDRGHDRGRDGHQGGRHSDRAPRSYQPAAYTQPNYDVPQYTGSQDGFDEGRSDGGCDRDESQGDRNQAQGHEAGWSQEDREKVRDAVREYVQEANDSAAEAQPQVETEVEQPAETAEQPAPVEAEQPAETATTTTVATASEPQSAVQAPGQQWEGTPEAVDTSGAELTAYVPGEGAAAESIEQDASTLTEATLDAPVRLATTGAEATALTATAGALVLGGAGSLLVARRGRVRA